MDNRPHHRQRCGPGKFHPGWTVEDGRGSTRVMKMRLQKKNDLNIKGLRKALRKTDETGAHFCRNSSFHGQSVKSAEDYTIMSERFSLSD